MASIEQLLEAMTPDDLKARLRALAQVSFSEAGVDDLELKHLIEILRRSSLLLLEGYDPGTMDRILSGEQRPVSLLERLGGGVGDAGGARLSRLIDVPDLLRTYGDRCLYDVGLAGRHTYRGIELKDLGPRSYVLASRVLALLADDRTLRDFYDHNLMERMPIDEEVLFLKQCATRFQVYAQLLQALRSGELDTVSLTIPLEGTPGTPVAPADSLIVNPAAGDTTPRKGVVVPEGGHVSDLPRPASIAGIGDLRGVDRIERLARYERAILFAALDLARLRAVMRERVVDQTEAVDRVCDDLAVFALGTRGRPLPMSYLFAGPTGVGKNYLVETLAQLLETEWGVELPLLVLEGPQYTYPSDVSELKGSTRGFIRSDEEGLLAEFHQRARLAPLSFVLVDEVEKAHPQLPRFFLSLMDRGATMDNKGRLLSFPSTLLVFTSNLGYSEEQMRGRPIGYDDSTRKTGRSGAAGRSIIRALAPEFLNRLKIVHFRPLSRSSAGRIVDQELERIAARYRDLHGIDLSLTSAAREALVEQGFSEEYGARHLVAQVERTCNVEVGLRLHTGAGGELSAEGRSLLTRIREARRNERAIDEDAIRSAVARETRLHRGVTRVRIDCSAGAFEYLVETD